VPLYAFGRLGWALYDCDFNQMLELPVTSGAPRHIRDFDLALLDDRHYRHRPALLRVYRRQLARVAAEDGP